MKRFFDIAKSFLNKTSVRIVLAVLVVALSSLSVGVTLARYISDIALPAFTMDVYPKYDINYQAIGYATLGDNTNNPASYSKVTGEITLQPAPATQDGMAFVGWMAGTSINTDQLSDAIKVKGSSAIDDLLITRLVINENDASVTAYNKNDEEISLSCDSSGKISLYALYKAYWTIGNTTTTYHYCATRNYMVDENGHFYSWNAENKDVERDSSGNPVTYETLENSKKIQTYYSRLNSTPLDKSTNPSDVIASQYIGGDGDILVIEGTGDVNAFAFKFVQKRNDTITEVTAPWAAAKTSIVRVIIPETATLTPTFLSGWFDGMTSLTSIYIGSKIDTSQVSNMDYTFRNCTSLTNIQGFSNVKGTHVFQSRGTFQSCSSLTEIDMTGFVNPGAWAQSNTNYTMVHLNEMFDGCNSLRTIVGLEQLDTTQFYNIGNLFRNCYNLSGELVLNMFGDRVGHEPTFSAAERARNYEGFMENTGIYSTGIKLHYSGTVRISLILALIHTSSNPQTVYCQERCGFSVCRGYTYHNLHTMVNGNYVTILNDDTYCTEETLNELLTNATNNNPYADQGYTLYVFQIRQGNKHDIAYNRISTDDPNDPNSLEKIMATFQNPTAAGSSPIYVQPIYRKTNG